MKYRDVEKWDETDLSQLPNSETDLFEYKSSKIPIKALSKKISSATSAFWNSGGGIFIAGVDDNGKVDGGIPNKIGNQSIRDWTDQVIASVEPPGKYTINAIGKKSKSSDIDDNHVVLVIAFDESYSGLHMAQDKKYYIRAGAHTGPAGHFLVEAIRARRGLDKPMLVGLIRPHTKKAQIVELVILAANNAPAFDVKLNFDPLPKIFQESVSDYFPITIPVIDKMHPFAMEISFLGNHKDVFGDKPVDLQLTYFDVTKLQYSHTQTLDISDGIGPIRIGNEINEKIQKSLDKIHVEMKGLRRDAIRLLTDIISPKREEPE